ncbi:hypothetical protein [Salinisphaera sp. G21_0]|uniref:hypothetical protein n=1 Tax=Salinisphaera sp. G21_0 TaxID=2821094 RepID=UPI001AD9DB60|nr:hypothetical protein [Salinisphaera sp. G21_0]MBO9481538.1 hypothetical protein [Salinisphaera sp. G21_0]
MIRLNSKRSILLLTLVSVTLTGCVMKERHHFTDEAADTRRLAVKSIMVSQRLHPNASEQNSDKLLSGEDGGRAAQSLGEYRGSESSDSSENNSITLDLGN